MQQLLDRYVTEADRGVDVRGFEWHLWGRRMVAEADVDPLLLRGHEGPVEVLAFLPDGAQLVSGGSDGTLIVNVVPQWIRGSRCRSCSAAGGACS